MTIQIYVHSKIKRAETVALVDSGVTKNFINLNYAKWLKLPIKVLPEEWKLFNVDKTENKAGKLKFYTDLQVQTRTQRINLCFFLTELGKHKAILGYLWFMSSQLNIDWK